MSRNKKKSKTFVAKEYERPGLSADEIEEIRKSTKLK